MIQTIHRYQNSYYTYGTFNILMYNFKMENAEQMLVYTKI